jgi:hypothetical protein
VNTSIEPALDAVVMKALAYERENRYPTAQALGEALLGILHKRGRSVGAGDVARFFDQHFQHELEMHSTRMRELITGGRSQVQDLSWHPGEAKSDSAASMPDEEVATIDADVGPVAPPPVATPAPDEGTDAGPTRVDSHPLRVAAANRDSSASGSGSAPRPLGKHGSSPGGLGPPARSMTEPVDPAAAGGPRPSSEGPTVERSDRVAGAPAPPRAPSPPARAATPPTSDPTPPPDPAPEPDTLPKPGAVPVYPVSQAPAYPVAARPPGVPAPKRDLATLLRQARTAPTPLMIVIAFALAAGVGMGATLLLATLLT